MPTLKIKDFWHVESRKGGFPDSSLGLGATTAKAAEGTSYLSECCMKIGSMNHGMGTWLSTVGEMPFAIKRKSS